MSTRKCAGKAGRCMSERGQQTLEGERKAQEYLARLHAIHADPDELALMVSMLYGAVLRGFCAVITKALRGGTS